VTQAKILTNQTPSKLYKLKQHIKLKQQVSIQNL